MPKQVKYKTFYRKRVCCTWKNKKQALRESEYCNAPLYKVTTVVTTKRV